MAEATFGERVRKARLAAGMKQADLAKQANISRNYLSQIEREEATNLSWQVRKKLADIVGISIEEEPDKLELLSNLPPGLAEFARERALPEADILMLARLQYRGQHPTQPEQWKVLYSIIKTVIMDE